MRRVVALVAIVGCSRAGEPHAEANPTPSVAAAHSASVATPAPSVAAAPLASSAPEPKRRCITPESLGATPLTELKGGSDRERRAVVAARAELKRVLENPNDFYATVQATDDLVLLELWHRSAFLPENCNEIGNPGGKCRTLGYDPKRDRITSTKFWQ